MVPASRNCSQARSRRAKRRTSTRATDSFRLPHSTITLRERPETLERAAITVRVLARSLADSTWLSDEENPVRDRETRRKLAEVLREISAAVRAYGNLATEFDAPGHQALESELQRNSNTGQDQQAGLSEVLEVDPEATPPAWPLRGELLSHLDRLGRELQVGKPDARSRPRKELWRLPRMIGYGRRG